MYQHFGFFNWMKIDMHFNGKFRILEEQKLVLHLWFNCSVFIDTVLMYLFSSEVVAPFNLSFPVLVSSLEFLVCELCSELLVNWFESFEESLSIPLCKSSTSNSSASYLACSSVTITFLPFGKYIPIANCQATGNLGWWPCRLFKTSKQQRCFDIACFCMAALEFLDTLPSKY